MKIMPNNITKNEKHINFNKTTTAIYSKPISFYLFLIWSFILIARPQDIFTKLSVLRPALLFGVISLISFVFQYSQFKNKKIFQSKQNKLFLLLISTMLLSIPFAFYRGGAFKFFTTVYLNAIVFYFLFFIIIDSLEKIETIIFLCCTATFLYSLSALRGGTSIGENRLIFGGMFDPNDLAYFIISFLPFNFIFIKKNVKLYKRLLCFSNIIIGIVVIFLTGSRGGFLALGTVSTFILMTKSEQFTKKTKLRIVILILISIPIIANKIDFTRLLTITDVNNDYNMYDETGRIQIWKRGLRLIYDHPFTGVGLSCFSEAIGEQRKKEGLIERWQAPHNVLIQIGTETGIFGALIYSLLCYNAFKIFIKVQKKFESASLITELIKLGFIGNFVASMFLSQAYSIYFVLFISLSACLMVLDSKTMQLHRTTNAKPIKLGDSYV